MQVPQSRAAQPPQVPQSRISATLALDETVSRVKLVSPARARALAKLGVHTVRDLLIHYPRRYIDLSSVESVSSAKIGSQCTIIGKVHDIKLKRPRPNLTLVEIGLVDETGILIITCFRQPWLMDTIKPGATLAAAGKLEFNYGYKRMTNPFLEIDEGTQDLSSGRIIPVHPATEKLSCSWVRRLVINGLAYAAGLLDELPASLRVRRKLMSKQTALNCIHFPHSLEEARAARFRLAYEELLLLELFLITEQEKRAKGCACVRHVVNGVHLNALEEALPFELTSEQIAAKNDILQQMAANKVANHLLLGDVGTGKTVVAAFAIAAAKDTGGQAFLMAPTEVLAQQHAKSLHALFETAGIKSALLTSSTPAPERAGIITLFASGDIDVLVGTHALLEDDVQPAHLTLAIIDEQQRFGVEQRARLLKKGQGKAERKAGSDGISVNSNANIPCAPDAARTNPDAPCAPDALYLTATPIPRSLALALFGGLSLSYIKERPHNNVQRTTKVCRKQQLGDVYDKARAALERGEQVYVVCPLVGKSADERNAAAKGKGTEAQMSAMAVPKTKSTSNSASSKPANKKSSEKSSNPFDTELDIDEEIYPCISIEADSDLENDNVSAAITEARILEDSVFSCWKVALLHGKMPSAEKVQVMQDFREGKIQVLVATTVIEVGVDVPNATVMIIQDADRFGLSQLHQLRGRVGRGCKPGEVYLVSASSTEAALARLRAMESTEDGFELASFDLSLRREGDILGNRQSGASSLKLVNVVRDKDIIEAAHVDAKALLEADPYLEEPKHRALAREMHIQFKNEHAKAGG